MKFTTKTQRVKEFSWVFALLFLLISWAPSFVSAQQPAPPQDTVSGQSKEVTSYTLPPEKYKQAIEYSRARYRLYFISTAYGFFVLLLVMGMRWTPRFRDLAEKASTKRFVQALVFVPLLFLTLSVLQFPTDIYGHSLSLKYNQSVQGWGSWMWDWTKGQLIAFVIMTLVAWILYGVIRRSPKRWWFYFWLASLPIIVFLLFITPVLIEPLFFKFVPLNQKHPDLVMEIEKVVQRGGLTIPRERMFEMNASEKMKSVNAYVTGFSASKRVVVWDNTIVRMTVPQILFVFGHEMGHYVLGHIPRTIAFVSVILLVFLYLGFHGMRWIIACFGDRFSIHRIEDWESLPVLLLLISLFGFLASPIFSTYSRNQEHDADIYGLEVIHGIVNDSPQAAAQAFQVLGEINLSDPKPGTFIKIWLYDHPPLDERVHFAHDYDPWSKGQSPKFVK